MKKPPLLPPSIMRWATAAAWVITTLAAILMMNAPDWSPTMEKLSNLGFPSGGMSPVIAMQLAPQGSDIAEMLNYGGKSLQASSEQSEIQREKHHRMDVEAAQSRIHRDWLFIGGYASLFILLAMRHGRAIGWILGATAVLIAVADGVENLQTLKAISSSQNGGAHNHALLWWSSATKWMLTFAFALVLGFFELSLRPYKNPIPTVLRIGVGLLMMIGGIVGLTWVLSRQALVIENAFLFLLAATTLIPAWIWNGDQKWISPGKTA